MLGITYVRYQIGHRASYQTTCSETLGLEEVSGELTMARLRQLIGARRLLFSTIDDSYFDFFLVAFLRLLFGRRTVGLFLRPAQCFIEGHLRYRVKKWFFRFVRCFSKIVILTIQPMDLHPEHAIVADDWVTDPQMWDVANNGQMPPETDLSVHIRSIANGRKVMCFVGYVAAMKGYHFMQDIACHGKLDIGRLLIVSAGKIEDDCLEAAKNLEKSGAMVVDEYLSEEQLQSLYTVSDLIWCCYAPYYDQSSGILGRSLQIGRIPIVRKGSIIEKYADLLDAQVISIAYGDVENATNLIGHFVDGDNSNTSNTSFDAENLKAQFIEKIEGYL